MKVWNFSHNSIALKNADSLLQDVMKAVDTDGDGHIQYSGMESHFDTFKLANNMLRISYIRRTN